MTNNINNVNGFNSVNFNGNPKAKNEKPAKAESSQNESYQCDGSYLEAQAAAVQGGLNFQGAYKMNMEQVKADVETFAKEYPAIADEALDMEFKGLNEYALNKFGE